MFDISVTTPKSLKVLFNGKRVQVTCFKDYASLYLKFKNSMSGTKENVLHNNAGNESSEEPQYVYKQLNDRWEICVAASDGYFQQVSFVNNIATTKGGTHVNYITEQLTAQLLQVVEKKRTGKGGMTLKPHHVKNQLFVMINCLVDNPSFDSQTKVTLTSRKGSFGSKAGHAQLKSTDFEFDDL